MATKRHSMKSKPSLQNPDQPPTKKRRRFWRYLLVVPGLVVAVFAWTLIGAAVQPGNQSFAAKWADYLRANHMGLIAQKFEEAYYSATAPGKGGRPKALNKVPSVVGPAPTTTTPTTTTQPKPAAPGRSATSSTTTSSSTTTTTAPPGLPAPKPVPLVVSPALPGEGQWQPTGPLVDGRPAMYEAQFRADTVYTSQITSAVWIDTKLLKLELVPGSTEPGGTWSHPPYVTSAELPYLVAAFNGGFRFQDARGGIYLEGKQGVPLVNGAASFVVYKEGRVAIGSWGTQLNMTPDVVSVLQNVVLLVDHGKLAPSATYTDNAIWGYTLGGGYVVPRSGIGVTADGALVYVAGPALTARSLAESLQRAGAVEAMTLDINPEWVTFNFYHHTGSQVSGTKLYPEMQRSADRYLPPVQEARDFYEILLPGAPVKG